MTNTKYWEFAWPAGFMPGKTSAAAPRCAHEVDEVDEVLQSRKHWTCNQDFVAWARWKTSLVGGFIHAGTEAFFAAKQARQPGPYIDDVGGKGAGVEDRTHQPDLVGGWTHDHKPQCGSGSAGDQKPQAPMVFGNAFQQNYGGLKSAVLSPQRGTQLLKLSLLPSHMGVSQNRGAKCFSIWFDIKSSNIWMIWTIWAAQDFSATTVTSGWFGGTPMNWDIHIEWVTSTFIVFSSDDIIFKN